MSLVCSVLLFWGGPGAYSSRSFQQAWNLGHPLLFAILTYLALKWSGPLSSCPLLRQVVVLLAAVFVISLPIEFLQMELNTRYPDVFDIMRNMAGALFAVVFFSPSQKNWLRGWKATPFIVTKECDPEEASKNKKMAYIWLTSNPIDNRP